MKMTKRLVMLLATLVITISGTSLFNVTTSQSVFAKSKPTITKVEKTKDWTGVLKVGKRGTVRDTVNLNSKDHTYKLLERNTVSQVWQRFYTGKYQVKKGVIILTPKNVDIKTYANEDALKHHQVDKTDNVKQENFQHQFGNHQIGKIKVQKDNVVLMHDGDKITLSKGQVIKW